MTFLSDKYTIVSNYYEITAKSYISIQYSYPLDLSNLFLLIENTWADLKIIPNYSTRFQKEIYIRRL